MDKVELRWLNYLPWTYMISFLSDNPVIDRRGDIAEAEPLSLDGAWP